ncbi:MAG: PadR family transcriptional regulator [Spirochaetae bacterium HGW-Spirochaetae-4]|nr:MAG: PadR family transcriptional regulator [Spirochaetae bacterium HGW-Spirochaetae-4]HCS36771.1 PadR family transcriptional regulator [Sphaerochaeta sp.]
MNIPKDLVAASATPIILSILHGEDSYGYAIIRKVQDISDSQIAWTDGMLYPVLHRLETAGFIDSYWKKSDNGRRRKYYHITAAGIDECELLVSQWEVVHRALHKLLQEKTGY